MLESLTRAWKLSFTSLRFKGEVEVDEAYVPVSQKGRNKRSLGVMEEVSAEAELLDIICCSSHLSSAGHVEPYS